MLTQTRRYAPTRSVAAAILLAALLAAGCGKKDATLDHLRLATSAVRQGELTVHVTQGGTLQTTESTHVRNEVKAYGERTILKLIPEGTAITQKDVDDGLVLVELDAIKQIEQAADQDIALSNDKAALTQAQEELNIQKRNNQSDITAAALKLKFARMEFERYTGRSFAAAALADESAVNFDKLSNDQSALAGQARQDIRAKQVAVDMATDELNRAKTRALDTEQLVEKGYVSRDELATDQQSVQRRGLDEEKALEDQRLFLAYTLSKEAERRHADVVEAQLATETVAARARSRLAQAEAKLRAREIAHTRSEVRLKDTQEMIEKSVIRATKPGLVVYASTRDRRGRSQQGDLREGATVRQNQTILEIPDLRTLAAIVDIHETDIGKIRIGQRAVITVDALPGVEFTGTVKDKAPMARSGGWMNQDVRVYKTTIAMDVKNLPDGVTLDQLTPGMTATTQIVVRELKDVYYVPLNAVTTHRGRRLCWVLTDGSYERRYIETGITTNKYVVVTKGLTGDERVFLAPPEELPAGDEKDEEPVEEADRKPREKPAAEPAVNGNQPGRPAPHTGGSGTGNRGGRVRP
jgi:HlyD family secretion protein